jgi:hypothetical protein
MAYKIFGNDIKDGQYFTMIGSEDVFVFRGTGFKNLRDVNVTISKHKYHKFRPYFLQKSDLINIDFDDTGAYGGADALLIVDSIEYNTFTEAYKVIYSFNDNTTGKIVKGSWTLGFLGIKKIKIP